MKIRQQHSVDNLVERRIGVVRSGDGNFSRIGATKLDADWGLTVSLEVSSDSGVRRGGSQHDKVSDA